MKNIASLTLERDLHYAKNGIANCLISGVTWGIDAVVLGYLLTQYPFNDPNTAIQAPLIAACIHTGFSSFLILLYTFFNGKIKEFGRCLFSKVGVLIVICAFCSGPLAMSGYLLSINMAGPAYAAVITSSYPAIGTALAIIFLKERLNKRTLIGILLCIVGSIATGYISPTTALYPNFYLGIIFAFIAALGWGLEGVFGAYAMDIVDPEIAILVRQTTSFLMYVFCVIPFIKGFKIFFNAFTTSNIILFLLVGLLCSTSYISWYRGLSMTGVGRAMALNITYPIWVIILEWLIKGVPPSPNLIIGCSIIVFGAILVSGNPKEMLKLREYKE
ncbi:DMT family transporter [Clostridium aestuarii]|uniref:DMT family transporter n=1 Tax=Clostridium aestuarii TaxID=338193 RepID=A0ABT4D1C8_9CLOT|nr:DMT family transporter [Clostridium aestuarii]MCY6485051.1 DMT family transporter [Clostridium aestuarii]